MLNLTRTPTGHNGESVTDTSSDEEKHGNPEFKDFSSKIIIDEHEWAVAESNL